VILVSLTGDHSRSVNPWRLTSSWLTVAT